MRSLKIEGTAVMNVSKHATNINGKSLTEILYKELDLPEYKDFYAKISISIEPLETSLTVNGESWPLNED